MRGALNACLPGKGQPSCPKHFEGVDLPGDGRRHEIQRIFGGYTARDGEARAEWIRG